MPPEAAAPPPLDLRGLKCPLVVLKIRRAMAGVAPGGTLTALADDPMALVDVPVMCHHARFELVEAARDGGRLKKPEGYVPPEKPGPIK
jgi:tRNA 2-thiouridine synthesizing protein A